MIGTLLAASADSLQDMLFEFRFLDAIMHFLTAGGNEALSVVMPTFIYGVIMTAFFAVGRSPIIPVVLSIIFAAGVWATVPAGAAKIIGIAVLGIVSVAGLALQWRLGE